jgi:hypothetical protein
MKSIQIDDAIEQFLLAHAAFIGESPSGILRRVLGIAPPGDAIEVDDDIYQFLLSHAASLGESSISILHRELHLDGAGPGSGPSTVEFHIAAGTAGQPWNTKDTAVVATVGDTLRIFNDDSVPHRLHTDGKPFPHPANSINPGQSADFLLGSPFALNTSPGLYDHNFTNTARFWLLVEAAP